MDIDSINKILHRIEDLDIYIPIYPYINNSDTNNEQMVDDMVICCDKNNNYNVLININKYNSELAKCTNPNDRYKIYIRLIYTILHEHGHYVYQKIYGKLLDFNYGSYIGTILLYSTSVLFGLFSGLLLSLCIYDKSSIFELIIFIACMILFIVCIVLYEIMQVSVKQEIFADAYACVFLPEHIRKIISDYYYDKIYETDSYLENYLDKYLDELLSFTSTHPSNVYRSKYILNNKLIDLEIRSAIDNYLKDKKIEKLECLPSSDLVNDLFPKFSDQ